MKHIILFLLTANFLGCANQKKVVCNSANAYNKGFRLAMEGDSDEIGSEIARTCADHSSYNTASFMIDFKKGYTEGLDSFCSIENYKRFAEVEASNGSTSLKPPHKLKICFDTPKYQATAKKEYGNAFKSHYCSAERMEKLGQKQALSFEKMSYPKVKNICRSSLSKLTSAFKKAYQTQMKENCTQNFWLLKGETDAATGVSKASQLTKIKNCPASKRGLFTNTYSSSYNQKTGLLMQERRYQQERSHQNRQYELQKKQLQVDKERLAEDRRRSTRYKGVQGNTFYYNGSKIYSKCYVDSRRSEARVLVKNQSTKPINISASWLIRYYDEMGKTLEQDSTHQFLKLTRFESKEFTDSFAPRNSTHCTARIQ